MNVWGTTVTGTVLLAMEFRDFWFKCYNVTTPNLKNRCNGCSQYFPVRHILRCRHGGLVNARHKKANAELPLPFTARPTPPPPTQCVHGEPLIYQVHIIS